MIVHDLSRRTSLAKPPGHAANDRVEMDEEPGPAGAEMVDATAVRIEEVLRRHHPIKSASPATVDAAHIVQFTRASSGQAKQEAFIREEARPFAGDEDAIGLEGVGEAASLRT